MSPKTLASRRSIDSCAFQLHSWKPFSPNSNNANPKTLDSDSYNSSLRHCHTKRPCLSDRATSFSLSISDALDMSKLTLFEDDKPYASSAHKRDRFRWKARKRRRRGSRSVSGRSSDRSATRNGRCCSVGATATCSDFMVAAGGTDSSGELFVNGNGVSGAEGNWSSDVSDAKNSGRERGDRNRIAERECHGSGLGFDVQCTESGYGSESGYRGDAEFGYGDELDEDDDDSRFMPWRERLEDRNMEMVGENTFAEQKMHYRGRRKKNELKMVGSVS